jgi:hypothetical protein
MPHQNPPATRDVCARDVAFVVLTLLLAVVPAWAFGKNKVHYQRLAWSYLGCPSYNIYYHQGQDSLPDVSFRWAAEARRTLSAQFAFGHRKPVPIIVYASPNLFEQTNVLPDLIPEGVGGFTEMFKNRVVVPFTGSYTEYRHVLHHEMVHAFEFGILYGRIGGTFLRNGVQMPLWFAEGLAEFLSSGWDSESDMFLMDKMVHGEVPPPGPELGGYMAYKGGQSFFHFLRESRGDSLFLRFLRTFRDMRTVETALDKVYGTKLDELGEQWRQQLKRNYWPEIALRADPADYARDLTSKRFAKARYNLKPRISPDGTKVAFFSDASDFTHICIVDREGKPITRIGQRGYGGYFESFHPFRSGLCWSPDSRRLAFVTKRRGRDEIRIVEPAARTRTKVLTFPQLSGICAPDWSADGRYLVFVGLKGDRSDLYLYSLERDSLARLTNDVAYEGTPSFSPDGRRVVYSVEDTCGRMHGGRIAQEGLGSDLAVIDLASGVTRRLTLTNWNEKEPRFVDSATIVFVSDRNGIDNVYRGRLDSLDAATPLTDFIGACSDPDWARDTSLLVFTIFQKGAWQVFLMNQPGARPFAAPLQPTRWAHCLADTSVAFFAPAPKRDTSRTPSARGTPTTRSDARHRKSRRAEPIVDLGDTVTAIHLTDTARLPPDTMAHGVDTTRAAPDSTGVPLPRRDASSRARTERPALPASTLKAASDSPTRTGRYRLKFSPDLVTLGLGVSSLYGYAGQWLVAMSDLMGDHRIVLAGDIEGRLNAHIYGSYLNSHHRLAFGMGGFYGSNYTLQNALYHDISAGAVLFLSWPFSLNSRLDFDAYYSHVERTAQDAAGASRAFDVLMPSLTWVFDNVVWGLTGPVNGARACVSATVTPPGASFDAAFAAGEMDVRRYIHLGRRFVLAARVAAGAAESFDGQEPVRRYILGGTDYWFNYRINSRSYTQEIGNVFYSQLVVPFRGWYYYDLAGSRYAVLNTEFRFPFIKEVTTVWPLPLTLRYINGAVFVDMGNAWDRQDQLANLPLPRKLYGGVGFGLRTDLGIFVLRYDRAWRTDFSTFINRPVNYWSLGSEF